MKTILLFPFLLLLPKLAFATPIFLGLSGHAQCAGQDQLLAEVESTVLAPLNGTEPHLKTFYNYQADSDCELSLGIITEAKDAEGQRLLADYMRRLEKDKFHGLEIKFQAVVKMEEAVTLTASTHVAGKDDSLNYQTEKSFPLNSVAEWEDFTNTIGRAFQSRRSADFQAYLTWFLGREAYEKFAREVLTKSNTVGVHLGPKLILANGTVVDEESGVSPFFEMPFYRNCWASDYEHGSCLPSPPND